MLTASELAGFFAAHAIWCVSDGAILVPMLGYTTENGERRLERFAHERLEDAVAQGKARLNENPMDADDAALLYDGRITLGKGKVDAILIEVRAYFSLDSQLMLAVPYTPKSGSSSFRVHKPKLLQWEHCEDFDRNQCFVEFFNGVDKHAQGAPVWQKALDESI